MTLNLHMLHCKIERSVLSKMKIREGFVRNAENLNSGTASAKSLAVGTGGTVLVMPAASRHRSAGERNCVLTSTW